MLGVTILLMFCCSLTCRYVDEGRNPELFTRHQLERTLSDHIGIQKKVQAYKVNSLVMPWCACASEVYISVFVCLCRQTATAAQGSMKCK